MNETDALQKIANKPVGKMTPLEYAVWRLYIEGDAEGAIRASNTLARFVDLEIQSRKVIVKIANSDLQIEEEQINAEEICNDWIDTFGKEAE